MAFCVVRRLRSDRSLPAFLSVRAGAGVGAVLNASAGAGASATAAAVALAACTAAAAAREAAAMRSAVDDPGGGGTVRLYPGACTCCNTYGLLLK